MARVKKTIKIDDMTVVVEDGVEVVISGKTVTIKTSPPIYYYPFNPIPWGPYTSEPYGTTITVSDQTTSKLETTL